MTCGAYSLSYLALEQLYNSMWALLVCCDPVSWYLLFFQDLGWKIAEHKQKLIDMQINAITRLPCFAKLGCEDRQSHEMQHAASSAKHVNKKQTRHCGGAVLMTPMHDAQSVGLLAHL